jgi:hypothetical protein
VPTALRDAAQLLDVQVDQVAWPWVLEAADRAASRPVQPGQPVAAMADQDPMHGGGRQAEPGGDPCGTQSLTLAQPEDALFQPGSRPPWTPQGDA